MWYFRSDCINGLTSCIDYNRLPQGVTPETICDILTPTGHDLSCTALTTYLGNFFIKKKFVLLIKIVYPLFIVGFLRMWTEPNPFRTNGKQVSFPCRPNPCNTSEVCLINRDCGANQKCPAYKCVPGENTIMVKRRVLFQFEEMSCKCSDVENFLCQNSWIVIFCYCKDVEWEICQLWLCLKDLWHLSQRLLTI